jgi:hypothetical protein
MATSTGHDALNSWGQAFGTEVVFWMGPFLSSDNFSEIGPMKLVRMLLFLGFVTAVLLIAAGGKFHVGIFLAIGLTLLICLLEPSMAK